ncbi:MAG: hypothetical protein ACQKBT_10250 [Puniceicoccales bacterium]
MSEAPVRYRKTPKAPFIAGNILLAGLGVALVFFGPDPWSMATVLLVVLCLSIGGVLTLLPFLLDQFALLNLNRSRSAQASVNLRAAIEKADDLIEELRERKIEENPLRLVSERLPELVQEKLAEAMEKSLKGSDDRPTRILEKIEELATLRNDLERLHDDLRVLSTHAVTREYVEAGFSNRSEEFQRMEMKLDDLRRFQMFGTPDENIAPQPPEEDIQPPAQDEAVAVPTESEEPAPEEIESVSQEEFPTAEAVSEDTPDQEDEFTEDPEPVEPPPPEPEPVPASESKTPPEPEPSTEPLPEEPKGTSPTEPSKNSTQMLKPKSSSPAKTSKPAKVIVSAFVGIQNGIYLRGNGNGLSPDHGIRLEMTGIGEWVWSGDIQENFSAELFLNDETPSDIGIFQINPGDVLKLNPSFPQETKD